MKTSSRGWNLIKIMNIQIHNATNGDDWYELHTPQSWEPLMLYSLSIDEGHRTAQLVVEEPQSFTFLDVWVESRPVRTMHLFSFYRDLSTTLAKSSPCCTRRHSSGPSPPPHWTTGWWRACRGRPPQCTSCTSAGQPPTTSSSWGRGQSPWREGLPRSALQRGTMAHRTFWGETFFKLIRFSSWKVWPLMCFAYPHINSRTFLVNHGL